MIKICLFGANGKMGKILTQLIKKIPSKYELKCAVVSNMNESDNELFGDSVLIIDNFKMLPYVDVIIDFSSPSASLCALEECLNRNIPLVIGTTGFDVVSQDKIKEASKKIPILFSSNMSLSVNILYKITEIVAKKLKTFDAEIIEAHHRNKKDSPSGTALQLGHIIADARNQTLQDCSVYTRYGEVGIRKPDEIGFSVVRGGDIVGIHEAMFITDGEILSLKSQITNRESFANGALLATDFIVTKSNGLYNMFDVLDL